MAVCWWLTAPLGDDSPPMETSEMAAPAVTAKPRRVRRPASPIGPKAGSMGALAKRLLLDMLLQVREQLETVASYTATFRKQERIKDVLGPEQTLELKIRHHPFAVYCKYLTPNEGKEVVYAEGHHEDKIIAHSGGMARLLVPRLAVAPDHPLAMSDNRHPITEAGLANLTAKLLGFREMDLDDPEAVTFLDRTEDAQGHPRWPRSTNTRDTIPGIPLRGSRSSTIPRADSHSRSAAMTGPSPTRRESSSWPSPIATTTSTSMPP